GGESGGRGERIHAPPPRPPSPRAPRRGPRIPFRENWDPPHAINPKGIWLCMKPEIPAMLERAGGAVANTSSVLGLVARRGSVPYAAAKHGVVGLSNAAALEFARSGIRVNAVCPAAVDTPMSDRTFANNPVALAHFLETQPNGRKALPEEVAAAVLWL